MLVLAMEFSRCGCRHRRRRPAPAVAHRTSGPRRGAPTRATAARRPQCVRAGCPFKTEQKAPGPKLTHGRRRSPATAVPA